MLEFVNLLLLITAKMGYLGIVLLMTIESSFIPFPSEVVIPPAAYLASRGEMDIILVIFSGILGSLIGATINYILALSLGRKIVYTLADHKFAKYILIDAKKIEAAEEYFLKYGNISTFIGRLLPAIRQLISIPAGFSKMNFKNFLFFTFLGSGIWTVILAVLGYVFGANQEVFLSYYKEIKIAFVILALVLLMFFVVKKIVKNNKKEN